MATRPFLKGSFLAKGLLFLMNHRRTKTKMFVNAFHRPRLLCGLSVVRGNYKRGEQRVHQNGEGRKTRGGEKNFSAPVSQKERGESRSGIPEKFRSTYNKLQCTCQNGVTTPLSCHVYQKRSLSRIHLLSQHIRLSTLPNLFAWSSSIGRLKQSTRLATYIKI